MTDHKKNSKRVKQSAEAYLSIHPPKVVKAPMSAGEKLRQTRVKLGIDLLQAERQTLIRAKYLEALESMHYYELPTPAYTYGFVQTYAQFLHLNPQKLLRQFQSEYGSTSRNGEQSLSYQSSFSRMRFVITSKIMWATIVAGLALLLVGYLGWQVYALSGLPSIVLDSPAQLADVTTVTMMVSGKTDPGATVAIGSEMIPVDENGQFNERISAGEVGVHTITVTAESRGKKKRTITRSFKVKAPTTTLR